MRAANEVERQRWVTALALAKAKAIKNLESGIVCSEHWKNIRTCTPHLCVYTHIHVCKYMYTCIYMYRVQFVTYCDVRGVHDDLLTSQVVYTCT